jgi:hypothetical protein
MTHIGEWNFSCRQKPDENLTWSFGHICTITFSIQSNFPIIIKFVDFGKIVDCIYLCIRHLCDPISFLAWHCVSIFTRNNGCQRGKKSNVMILGNQATSLPVEVNVWKWISIQSEWIAVKLWCARHCQFGGATEAAWEEVNKRTNEMTIWMAILILYC